ncbi:beta-catenin-interacting protein 1 isoform X2 [Orcinus orca]|uniref:beta-catenin-interacting protein 1 isoform X2 n=1 Tax=Orcinus orca TaxID=9733 RepID=UPI0021131A6A|nr:beta-catenin-interacting protein 1 isoform X2 [Orcinus orca]
MRATGCSWPLPPHHQVTPPAPGPPGALPWPRLRRPSGARCRPLRRSLPRRPGTSLSPRRGDSLNGRRRLRRLLPLLLLLLLLLPPRLLGLCAPRNRPPRAALGPAAPARPAGSGGPGIQPPPARPSVRTTELKDFARDLSVSVQPRKLPPAPCSLPVCIVLAEPRRLSEQACQGCTFLLLPGHNLPVTVEHVFS